MVTTIRADNSPATGCRTGHEQRNFTRLGARTAEYRPGKGFRVQAGESLGIVQDCLMQVTAVYVQRTGLSLHGCHHSWICMTHTGYVVVHVNVLFTGCVVQVDTLTTDDVHGLRVEKRHSLAKQALAAFEKCLFAHNIFVV